MSQEEFGEAIYNSRQTISKWERGESAPTSENIELICEKFNVSSEEIYGKHTEFKNDLSKKFNYKKLSKILAIILIIISISLIIVTTIKFVMLNKIINKIAEYENANNYYFEMDKYENEILTLNEKVWYLDGKYKIEDYYYNDVGVKYLHTIKWIDINEGTETTYNVNKNTYKEEKINPTFIELKNNYLYTRFPNFIKKDKTIFEKIAHTFYLKIKKLNDYIEITDSKTKLQISKDEFIPENYEIKNTENIYTIYTYKLTLNSATENDVKKEDL